MTIFVDIDDTICTSPRMDDGTLNYEKAKPITKRINQINKLYHSGHIINYWTARGSLTKKSWSKLTKAQLLEWGAKHHNLFLGKPHYDLFIDDKNQNAAILDEDINKYLV